MLAGRARSEDAAVVSIPPGKALVQTVDVVAPIVNSPYHFGRIAAANALSDVYALGGEPWCALNVVSFPTTCALPDGTDPELVLGEILRGGLDALDEAGAALVGGHTVADDIKYGLAVTGLIDPAHIATNDGLAPGDVLLLTKPLGTGVLSTAVQARWGAWEAAEAALIHWCGQLNAPAAALIRELGLKAATDITGFGLGGHTLEMALASDVAVELYTAALPLHEGALDYARDGLIPGASHANRAHWQPHTRVTLGVTPELETLVFDVQTSGGLLLAMPAEHVARAEAFLRAHGGVAAVVGHVRARVGDAPSLTLA